ncbi:MAG: hypothetical protein ACFHWX_05745 [Bacteroidota bacterium]
MIKKILLFLAALIVLLMVVAGLFIGPYFLNVEHFDSNSSRGYQADFYLYVSPGARELAKEGGVVTLLIQPNNSGTTSDDPQVHQRDAWFTGFERQKIADELNVVLLVPAFIRPATDWQIYTHALDRDVLTTQRKDLIRIDLQLLAMIDSARAYLEDLGISSNRKFLIQGFSASGMFANRFTALHPNRVLAATIGSPGGWPIAPVESYQNTLLPYPAGISDLESLTGKPFDRAAYSSIPQLIYMGSEDDNDSLDFSDGWEAETANTVDSLFGSDPQTRWSKAEMLYQKAGASAKFLLIDGVDHNRKALQSYSTAFFKEILDQK